MEDDPNERDKPMESDLVVRESIHAYDDDDYDDYYEVCDDDAYTVDAELVANVDLNPNEDLMLKM